MKFKMGMSSSSSTPNLPKRKAKTREKRLFVTCGHGIEPLLLQELKELGFEGQSGYCGVYVGPATMETIYKINFWSRLATRVLYPLRIFRVFNKDDLYDAALKVKWPSFLPEDKTFAIDANVNHPELRHSLYAAQVVKDAICDQLREIRGDRPSVDVRDPDVQFNLFIDRETAVLSLDTSGAPLHRRGYRTEVDQAPLQPNLAAAMLRVAGYRGEGSLVDPCCGSGTILIEAALMATNTPPGYLRDEWGFFNMAAYGADEWKAARKFTPKKAEAKITGFDISDEALEAARANCQEAGVKVKLLKGDVRDATIKADRVVTNPPHGRRLRGSRALYEGIGTIAPQGVVLAGEVEQLDALPVRRTTKLKNSGQTCYLGSYAKVKQSTEGVS